MSTNILLHTQSITTRFLSYVLLLYFTTTQQVFFARNSPDIQCPPAGDQVASVDTPVSQTVPPSGDHKHKCV